MKFAFVDLKIRGKKANRDHTGGFGSFMSAGGVMGNIVSLLKGNLIDLPVLSFGFSAALLREAEHEVKYYCGTTSGEDIILIASSMHCYKEERSFAKLEKKKYPNSKIGFFGPFVKTHPEFFETVADFLIMGEVETTLIEFIEDKCELTGHLNHGILRDMARLPAPDWRGLSIRRFSYYPLLHKRPFITMQTSRGCVFNCDFCPYIVSQTSTFRKRPPDNIIAEIQTQIGRHGIKSVLFRDIIFTVDRNHVIDICNRILSNKIKIEWACETRVDMLDDELVDIMWESGFRGVNLGIETDNAAILGDSGKKVQNIKRHEPVIGYLHKKGVRVNGFYMLGLLGDTPETMRNTIAHAERLNTLGAQFCTLTPFPGTPLFDRVKTALLTDDFSEYSEYKPVVDIKTSTPEEVEHFANQAYRYYFRSAWLYQYGLSSLLRLFVNLASARSF